MNEFFEDFNHRLDDVPFLENHFNTRASHALLDAARKKIESDCFYAFVMC